MYFDVFNSIVFDDEMNLISCVDNDYARAALTVDEMAVIVPSVRKIMNAENYDEVLIESEYLIDDLPLPIGTFERWEKYGLDEFEKYCIAFLYAAMKLEELRCRVCQVCGATYFSNDDFSETCEQCSDCSHYL